MCVAPPVLAFLTVLSVQSVKKNLICMGLLLSNYYVFFFPQILALQFEKSSKGPKVGGNDADSLATCAAAISLRKTLFNPLLFYFIINKFINS